MVKMMREQADLAFQILGVNHPFNDNPKALKKKPRTFLQSLTDYFEARTFRFATEVTRETNKKLQAAFKEGTAAGESIPQLASRVSTLFEEMAAYRSQRIARTETILASNFSTEAAYIDSGVVEGKEWLATMDERTDDECAGLDGKVVELGGEFFQNDYFDGQYPPIHVNCRCTLIPIVKA
jgi:SPP1 gp7 family putative phage head morphogenesis protein